MRPLPTTDVDPINPRDVDVLVERADLPNGEAPTGDGWRAMTGNVHSTLWMRAVYRFELGPRA